VAFARVYGVHVGRIEVERADFQSFQRGFA